jgi:hypothetical protein
VKERFMKRLKATLLAFVLLCVGAGPSLALDLEDLITQVRRNVRDTGTSLQRYSDAVITDYLNEGQRDALNQTWALNRMVTITLISGNQEYDLPDDCLKVFRVSRPDFILREVKISAMDRDVPTNWDGTSTSSGSVQSWIVEPPQPGTNQDRIAFSPFPNSLSDAVDLRVWYYALADDLALATDIPFDGEVELYSYHDLLGHYATFKILATEAHFDKAKVFAELYDAGIETMLENYGNKPMRKIAVRGE